MIRFLAPGMMFLYLLLFGCGAAASAAEALNQKPKGVGARNFALVIGVGEYKDLPELPASVADATAIGEALEATGFFRRVITLADTDRQSRFAPTRKNITGMFTLLARSATNGANIIVYYGGRGAMRDGEAYVLPLGVGAADGVGVAELAEILRTGATTGRILFLDAVGLDADNGMAGEVGNGVTAIVVSHQSGQEPVVDEESGRGLFSLAFVDALQAFRGEAVNIGGFVDHMNLFMSEYCLDHMVIDGQSSFLADSARDATILSNDASTVVIAPSRAAAAISALAESTAVAPFSADDASLEQDTPSVDSPRTGWRGDGEVYSALRRGEKAFMRREYEVALPLLTRAAELGSAEAENYLGMMYLHGLNVQQSDAEARKWFTRAADGGHSEAEKSLAALADISEVEVGMKPPLPARKSHTAMQPVVAAAPQAKPTERKGTGSGAGWLRQGEKAYNDKDYDKALQWFVRAAEQGNMEAENYLGKIYLNALGVSRNYGDAFGWFKRAADQGLADAQNNLGFMHDYAVALKRITLKRMNCI